MLHFNIFLCPQVAVIVPKFVAASIEAIEAWVQAQWKWPHRVRDIHISTELRTCPFRPCLPRRWYSRNITVSSTLLFVFTESSAKQEKTFDNDKNSLLS